jgi:HEAT repeat protein
MTDSPRRRAVLLTGQTFSLGLMLALVVIPANAIFLAEYGSRGLAYTYLGMAAIGVPSSMVLAATLRRWRLTLVTSATVVLVTAIWFGSWVALRVGAVWVSAGLLVLFIVVLQIGLVLVGGQAGRLFDIREIKAHFPRIISGFAAGLMVGGLLGPPMLAVFGSTEDLLLGAVAGGIAWLVFVRLTGRRYPAALALVAPPADVPKAPLRTLVTNRFVVLVFAYQVFSAMGSQLLDFMVFDRAAAIYTSSADLARVVSVLTAALNGTNILFLALFAGYLLRRFGLRLGINANPMVVSALVAVIVAASALTGQATFGLFLLVASSRVIDITLSDGMTRTSINAAYQALPPTDRLAVQATVEGVGVPVAIGVTGVLLIVADFAGFGFTFVAVTSLVLCLGWLTAGLLVYRSYGDRLRTTMRQRAFDPEALMLDAPTLAVLDGLLAGTEEADIRLALDVLAGTDHPGIVERLGTLAADPRPLVRADALRRMNDLEMLGDLEPARLGLSDGDAAVRRAAVAVLGRHGAAADRTAVKMLTEDADPEVRVAATVASAVDGQDLGARLRGLLADDDPNLRSAAITAAGALGTPDLLSDVLAALADGRTASAATAALPGFGEAFVSAVDEALGSAPKGAARTGALVRLVHACRACPAAATVLMRHAEHRDPTVQLAVLTTLAHLDHPAESRELAEVASRAVASAGEYAGRCLATALALDQHPTATHVVRGLQDEQTLAAELVVAALAVRYDRGAIERAVRLLRSDDGQSGRGLALEMLEVTLTPADHAILHALVHPDLTAAERHAELARRGLAPAPPDTTDALRDLATDAERRWQRPWLRACALHAIAAGGHGTLVPAVRDALTDPDPDVAEAAAWAADRLAVAGA